MSIHLDSEDYNTGTRYNGSWEMNRNIQGNYQVLGQSISVADIPWFWSDNNNLVVSLTEGMAQVEYEFKVFADDDIKTYQTETDKSVIASYIQTRLNAFGALSPPDFTVTMTYNEETDIFQLTWDQQVTINWAESGMAKWFNVQAETQTATTFNLNGAFITTTPRYLYLLAEEITGGFYTANGFIASIILSTTDNAVLNQDITITSTTELNIKIYLINDTTNPVPIKNKWEIVLSPK